MIIVPVELADRSYSVIVGDGVVTELGSLVPSKARRAAIVTQSSIPVQVETGIEQKTFVIGEGEQHKTLSTVETLCRGFAEWGMTRNDVVVGVGGGIVTDVAGFAASVYHRGIAALYVSTTLLGQVDAAIGGKTGVNLPEGKNLVGAFWQPSGVICDTATLASLPEREFRAGLGEIAKYHFLGGGQLDAQELPERVANCVRIKADVVAEDEREGGRRAILNYGHTLAHALEIEGEFDLRHGEAVAIGVVYAAEVARRLGRIDDAAVNEHRRVIAEYGLVDRLPEGTNRDQVLALFSRDKKALDDVTMVLDGPAGVETVVGPDSGVLREALDAMV